MKCPNCGIDLRPEDKVCFVCGTPVVSSEQTQLFTRSENNYPQQNEPAAIQQRSYHQQNSSEPSDNLAAESNSEIDDGYQNMSGDSFEPEENPKKKKSRKALVISIIALVLVIAIVIGVIVIVNNNSVSAAELKDAKEKYLPPAEAVAIDTSLDDPSNENIKFKYDARARIISCTYSANEKTYDQSYNYDDSLRKVTIETQYKKHPIFTKEIEYDRVSAPGAFEAVDGYYLRLDESCFTEQSDEIPAATEAPKAEVEQEEKPTQAPTQAPTEAPTEEPTEAPANDYKELYINYLSSCGYDGYKGQLIYLNDDDVPELVIQYLPQGAQLFTYVICWTNGDQVSTEEIYTKALYYQERTGYLTTVMNKMVYGGWTRYLFDGATLEAVQAGGYEESIQSSDHSKTYKVDGAVVSEEEYNSALGNVEEQGNLLTEDSVEQSALPDYIRSFE